SWLPAITTAGMPLAPQPPEETEHDGLGLRARVGGVENVSRHEQKVHLLTFQVAGQVVEHPRGFVEAVDAVPGASGVPVGRVYDAHDQSPSRAKGSSVPVVSASASLCRVAHEGNGK